MTLNDKRVASPTRTQPRVSVYIVGESHGGPPRHVALFGLRRIGKMLVCQEQMRRLHAKGNVIPVYLDLQDLASSPELFASTSTPPSARPDGT